MVHTTFSSRVPRALTTAAAAMYLLGAPAAAQACPGDCDGDGVVSVNELVMMVTMALGMRDMEACPSADANGDGEVTIAELVAATRNALDGCPPDVPTPTPTPGDDCDGSAFASTFAAIQQVIFENRGCTASVCHSSTAQQGELDLSPEVAYDNLFEVRSSETTLNRVQPGDKDRSYLWLKLAAATDPSLLPPGFQIVGAPMPNGLAPLTPDELEALRLWIYGGAPRTGTVPGTDELLNACLPKAEPILIEPLAPPEPGTGVQLRMPPWPLEAHSEHEICFATYYDITDQVPERYRDPSGRMFRFSTSELRQDPQSHHLILYRYLGPDDVDLHHPSFGGWTCNGGERAGEPCEPRDLQACGAGICTSAIRQSFACIGFGPPVASGPTQASIGGAQSAQSFNRYVDGVFAQIPLKGVLYWNSHAFNLTDQDTTMHAWLNYEFADPDQQRYPVRGIFDISKIFAMRAPPFTTETLCNDFVLPRGARLFSLSSHTHKHGQHFTVDMPDGTRIYENFVYNDPANITFDPPIAFDSPDPAARTLHYCSFFNNGVKLDGSPDIELVTRASLIPSSAQGSVGRCRPVACVAGRVGAACNGVGDDRACDSEPGANDGFCDACPLTGGESTQNEMFILIGAYYVPPAGGALRTGAVAAPSDETEMVIPPILGCSSSHAEHTEHANHDDASDADTHHH